MSNKISCKIGLVKFIAIWIILISFFQTNQKYNLPLGNFAISLFIDIILIFIIFQYKNYFVNKRIYNNKEFKWVNIFILYVIFNAIRGIFMANGYYEYKHLVQGFVYSIIPIFLFLFLKKDISAYIWRKWYKYGIILYFLYFIFFIKFDPFYLSPLLFLFCFFPLFRKHKLIIFNIAIIFIIASFFLDIRAHLGKGTISLLFGIALYYRQFITKKILTIFHKLCYLSFILIFCYVFTDFIAIMSGKQDVEEQTKTENYGIDTRSLLYYDILNSALTNDYYILGRSPARGNDINASAILFINSETDTTEFVRDERHANEVLHGNIFTWYGIIGVFIYFMIYYKATSLAVNKSNNIYISLLGCYVAFRWSCGWIEDANNFDILNISLWSMIGMCYSKEFRDMTNSEFKNWINQII